MEVKTVILDVNDLMCNIHKDCLLSARDKTVIYQSKLATHRNILELMQILHTNNNRQLLIVTYNEYKESKELIDYMVENYKLGIIVRWTQSLRYRHIKRCKNVYGIMVEQDKIVVSTITDKVLKDKQIRVIITEYKYNGKNSLNITNGNVWIKAVSAGDPFFKDDEGNTLVQFTPKVYRYNSLEYTNLNPDEYRLYNLDTTLFIDLTSAKAESPNTGIKYNLDDTLEDTMSAQVEGDKGKYHPYVKKDGVKTEWLKS